MKLNRKAWGLIFWILYFQILTLYYYMQAYTHNFGVITVRSQNDSPTQFITG